MRRYKDPTTNQVVTARFKKRWILLYPLFVIDLLGEGFVIAAILSILPPFTILFYFLYGGMMDRKYRRKGWIEINEFNQPIGAVPDAAALAPPAQQP